MNCKLQSVTQHIIKIIKMKYIKHDIISPTNPIDIQMDKISIGFNGLIKYNHPKYGKTHRLVLKLPVCKFDKFPIDYYQKSNANESININLKIPIDSSFTTNSFYMFIQNILEKYDSLSNTPKQKYPSFDHNKTENYLKIKEMDKFNYNVIEIINKDDSKLKVIIHKPTSFTDLQTIFKSYSYVVPYVIVYYHKTQLGDFITLKPVKFYVGENLTMEVIDYISRKSKKSEIPKSEFFDANQIASPVLLDDFLKHLQNENTNQIVNPVLLDGFYKALEKPNIIV